MTHATKIRLILADDHPIVRDGLRSILGTQPDFEIIGEAGSGAELLQLVAQLQPDVVLLDLAMPGGDGVSVIQNLRAQASATACIVFTAFDTDNRILTAIHAGARGYLLKGAPREDIFRAIRVVAQGGSLLEPSVTSRLLDHLTHKMPATPDTLPPELLTEREMEVLQLLGKGKTNKEIGAELFITERTVKFYVSAILSKLSANNRTEAVTIAVQRGLIQL